VSAVCDTHVTAACCTRAWRRSPGGHGGQAQQVPHYHHVPTTGPQLSTKRALLAATRSLPKIKVMLPAPTNAQEEAVIAALRTGFRLRGVEPQNIITAETVVHKRLPHCAADGRELAARSCSRGAA